MFNLLFTIFIACSSLSPILFHLWITSFFRTTPNEGAIKEAHPKAPSQNELRLEASWYWP